MSVIDILFRVDDICKKYDKYDVDKQSFNTSDDAFIHLSISMNKLKPNALQRSEIALVETNRAKLVPINAEVRRLKARLMEEIPKLQKLAAKKVKGISREEQETRLDLVLALPERIRAIPDGTTSNLNQTGGWVASGSSGNIKFDKDYGKLVMLFFQTKESNQYRQEYELRKMKQACNFT
ncbi:hypothetical protein Leryth_000673 [Lithospermum erythrorhizon]|nr:hypothetical protein Leryth_000673 [Lithospermum erythrorhizon]